MFDIDWVIALAGLGVGGVVGLTGMGGGALMTPILVLLFGVPPSVAVASDLAASLFMKPLGAAIHMRRGTVDGGLVRWLCIGSIPMAFLGAALINQLGHTAEVDAMMKRGLGGALLVAALATLAKAALKSRRTAEPGQSALPLAVRPLPTLVIGAVGGLVVGMTSVGSGSLVIVMLMLVYPRLTGSRLVGTDLAQAIPLVGSAALGHVVFGHVHLDLTASLLAGSIPGVLAGAHYSSRGSDAWVRPLLVVVLMASALKLLGASNAAVGAAATVLGGIGIAIGLRSRDGAAALSDETPLAPAAVIDGPPGR
ncbi:MAG: sulfite exporter TauE/SafE family protein [Deltaproteobacteria bacterium]|nr:sulfite exporter TauE/SafE family protein [Deltaproteobacteria bacterium]